MKMETQLSAAQDKIGVAKRRTKLLEEKNDTLQKELDSWNEETTPEVTSNLQSVASGSGLPYFGMPVSQPYTAMSSPVSLPVIGGPQVSPIPMSGPTLGPTPFGGPQGNRRVLFGSVLMRRQVKNKITMVIMEMVEQWDQELYRYNRRVQRLSIWESSPKTLRYFMDGPMKMSQRGWRRFLISSI